MIIRVNDLEISGLIIRVNYMLWLRKILVKIMVNGQLYGWIIRLDNLETPILLWLKVVNGEMVHGQYWEIIKND